MASPPVHAQWCAIHEQYYRGAVCPLCQRHVSPQEVARVTLPRTLVCPDQAKLRAARHARQWSTGELGRRAGLSRTHVREIETGHRQRRITLRTAHRLAEALHTTVAALTRDTAED